ncbi:DUF3427 domain-containing protein [Mollicutes bacterium LVI A0039]|nr:DUF3427 domain-containing protein [Mollicutes bacterium LVI A0039]
MSSLLEGISTSLIDSTLYSNEAYQVDLITNKNIKTITYLENNLFTCTEFLISVAFVTKSGVALLKPLLQYLEENNIKGKIVSGDYLGFTEPNALRELDSFTNVEVKLNFSNNLHSKGYFFKQNDRWNVIVGSSNLTQAALTSNSEWNLKVSTSLNGKLCDDIIREFHKIFHSSKTLADVIDSYEDYYLSKNKIESFSYESKLIEPNSMQREALTSLAKCRSLNNDKALIVSATGTGKTFLAAFDVKKYNPRRMLFIIHRENIAIAAMNSFKKIMPDRSFGLYTGTEKVPDAEYIFSTVQTLSKDRHLHSFSKTEFEYIIFDEAHHLGASTQLKVFNYFEPKFALGLTATPERNDDFNIYELFDYNIAYEIRLHDALNSNMLVPFHYYGIADKFNSKDHANTFEQLSSTHRVNNIIEKAAFYGYSGNKLHGLIFASSVKEVHFLESEFNKRGIPCKGLTGSCSESERRQAIELLEDGVYEYIITVDIFNEGIDIRCVNQVIFLRQTESAIIFIQQLGRGLRLYDNKEYLVVLDFIGNYNNDFLIPAALSQSGDYDKDNLLQFILSPNEFLPGESTVHFEQIAKERIFNNIKSTSFSNITSIIMHDFKELERRLGRRPLLNDFYTQRLVSPTNILNKYPTILDLYSKMYGEAVIHDEDYKKVHFISKFLTPAKRPHEFIILNSLLDSSKTFETLVNDVMLMTNGELEQEKKQTRNAIRHLMLQTYTSTYKRKYNLELLPQQLITYNNETYSLAAMHNTTFMEDLVSYNIAYFKDNYSTHYPLTPFATYTKKDISKLFLFEEYEGGINVQGYKFNHDEKTCIAFITLSNESEADTHDDKILSRRFIQWQSQDSKYLQKNGSITNEGKLLNKEYKLFVFIQKNKKEPFHNFGEIKNLKANEISVISKGKSVNKVEFQLELASDIPHELFTYLTT